MTRDEILKRLIETNIRQRGIGNTNPVKFGRCLKELERIYGIKVGNPHDSNSENNSELKTQDALADELGMDVRTLRNYKLLADMIPEMQDLVETGIVTPTTARAIVRQLPEDQQKEKCSSRHRNKKARRFYPTSLDDVLFINDFQRSNGRQSM